MINIRNYQGVTLLELLIVLAVIIILTVISVPSFVSLVQNHRLIGMSETLFYDLQYARTEAIKRNTTVYVSFSAGNSWCYGINAGSSCNCTVANSCGLLTRSGTAAQLVALSASGYGGNFVSFENTHGAANASGSLTMTLSQNTLIKISIGLFGSLQLCSTGIGGYTAC